MDIRRNPPRYKPRRAKGTPTWAFSRNWALGITALGSLFGIAHHYGPGARWFRKKIEEGFFEESKEERLQRYYFWAPIDTSEINKQSIVDAEERKLVV